MNEDYIKKFIENPGKTIIENRHRQYLKDLVVELKDVGRDVGYCLGFVSATVNALEHMIASDNPQKDCYQLINEIYGKEIFESYCNKIGGFAKDSYEEFCK